ncbi:hypothetical protein F503_03833 [Ophiostoma piceae UAMH 11346]|uniref:Uncharacterized protein n=1 Tax=Ophiostoma piceae (strain UAMH 11346) TaxID=1262450 RepID=S3CG43_OPHP1|nr:hypothetical protein F503_03833 [Ophiostoma piceae UAMH 11346]
MAIHAPSFRRRYMPQSGRFAGGPQPSPPSVKFSPLPVDDEILVTVVEMEMTSEVENETGETQLVTAKSKGKQDTANSIPSSPPDSIMTHLHSQTASPSLDNHAYTGSPLRLLAHDLVNVVRLAWAMPSFIWPLRPASSLSELAPTLANTWCIAVHIVLALAQACFLFFLLPAACILLPMWVSAVMSASFIGANQLACRLLLNGWRGKAVLHSRAACASCLPEHAGEQWIFLNGIGTGRHWLQGSIDRLAYTFGRPVMGIHNKTAKLTFRSGLVFDILECLVQRNLNYATRDVRATYAILKETLYRPDINKVVLVLHSQGGIVGSMALDWLLQELSHELLAKLEVYTFGNAANHVNVHGLDSTQGTHIEHYAHAADFAALWGVLHYTSTQSSPFAGRVFTRTSGRGGHQLCQHYLDGMFPLVRDQDTGTVIGCAEDSEFMNSSLDSDDSDKKTPRLQPVKVKDVSRLWQYRNGRCPAVI